MLKSKWHLYGAFFVLVCLLLWPISYAIVINSSAYDAATNFVKHSATVQSELGEVTNVRLSPFGYAAGFGFADGYADLQLSVKGQRGEGKVEIDLGQKGDLWQVARAVLHTSDGRSVDIQRKQP
jgi:hypothetical protein